ncbi:TetR/AcrR family transcriptional regulator [Breoghania sp.]|uniref:TetR/AcrR family transcriptional regulator n=1 Tax=Breoghania sp. TaxID=2065378 RepID=UPI002AA79FDA|nr:TetR/AcrR family transcriptional regulator [Breoghania sp.]
MRTRTDAKRQEILSAAADVFEEMGYQGASMSAISARVGGSKATLYGYFKSKESLFAAVTSEALNDQGERMLALLEDNSDDLRQTLTLFAERYILFMQIPQLLATARIAVSKGEDGKLGEELYELGPKRAWDQVAIYLAGRMKAGALRDAPPERAAYHLKGLLEAGIFEPILFGRKPVIDTKDAGAAAVDVFMRAYGTDHEG